MKEAGTGAEKRSLLPLWAMIGVFAAPAIAAWFFFLNPQYLPAGRTNHGELIEPVVPLPSGVRLSTPEGEPFERETLAGKWTLVFLADAECNEDCEARLRDMRQIRLALGEGSLSVERLLVLMEPQAADLGAALGDQFDGMRVALAGPGGAGQLLQSLGEGAHAIGRIYILDPMGNLMMRYAVDAPADDTLKDMERLLKASKNWIKGAQYGHK